MGHRNEDVVRSAYKAFGTGDIEAVAAFIAEDSVWHIAGSGILNGDYRGRDAILGFLGRLMEETGGSFRLEVHDVLANDDHAVALLGVTASRGGNNLQTNQTAVYHMSGEQSTEAWFLYGDAAGVAEIFA
jgi:ketosteroid isomerase-like protein